MIDIRLLQSCGIDAATWLVPVTLAASAYDISLSDDREAMWLAQCAHESEGFSAVVENLNYGPAGLLATWPRRFSPEQAVEYAHDGERIANRAYSFKNGNGDEESGDGWRYRGRGVIQVTGRANYERASAALGLPLVAEPELLEQPANAAMSAAWFWKANGCNELADMGQYATITRRINGGLTGQEDREAWLIKVRRGMGP